MSNLIKKGKKIFAISLAVTTMVWSFGLLGMPVAAVAASSGDLIKITCTGANASVCSAVYYLGADGKRYVFPNEKTYFTWYSDFNNVTSISQTEMESYMIGGNVTYRPGVKMVKITTDPKVYAVSANGALHWIQSEEIAECLYGDAWNTMIDDVSDAFFVNYTIGLDISACGEFDKTEETNNATSINEDKGLVAGTATGSSLSVALASDTPASGIVLGGQIRAPFTKINLTAASDGDVVIDNLVVQRTGLGQDGAFAGIDLIDMATNAPVNRVSKTFNSGHKANFTEDITIPAGTTKSFLVVGNMASSLATFAGEIPSLSVVEINMKGSAAVIGTLPVTGNYQNINGTIITGAITGGQGAYKNAATTLEVGRTNYTFLSFYLQPNSVEDAQLEYIKVYQRGSANLGTDLDNIKLYGQQTAGGAQTEIMTGVVDGKYVVFNLSTPIQINKGNTRQFEVRADVADGSGRTIELGVEKARDILVKGKTYNAYVSTKFGGNDYIYDNIFTVGNGTMQVSKTNDVAAGNITLANDQMIGSFKFTVKGEPIDVTELTLTVVSTTNNSQDIDPKNATKSWEIVDPKGNTVAGPTDVTVNAGNTTVLFTDTFTVPVGETIYRVRTDVSSDSKFASGNTIYVQLIPSGIIARGQVSGNVITPSPSSALASNHQTFKTANLTVTRDSLPASGSVVAGSSQVLLGSWTFDAANSGEDIRITTIAIAASSVDANNLTLYDGATVLSPINDAPTAPVEDHENRVGISTSTFTLSDPIIITKGAKKTLKLKGDISSSAKENQSAQFGITSDSAVTAYGKTTGNDAVVTVHADNGATLIYTAGGALTVSGYNTPAKALVVAGSAGQTVQSLKFSALREDVDVEKLDIFVSTGAESGTATGSYKDVEIVSVWDGAKMLAESAIPSTGHYKFSFDKGTIVVPKNGSKVITIKVDYSTISSEGAGMPGNPNASLVFGIEGKNGIKAKGNSTSNPVFPTVSSATSTVKILHASVPVLTLPTSANRLGAASSLTNSDQVIYAFKITADSSASMNRPVLVSNLAFEFTSTSLGSLKNLYLKDGEGNIISDETVSAPTSEAGHKPYVIFGIDSPLIDHGGKSEYIQIDPGLTKTIYLHGTVAGAVSGSSLAVSLLTDTASTIEKDANKNGQTQAVVKGVYGKSAGYFVWSDDWKNVAGQGNATNQAMWYNGHLISGTGNQVTTTAYVISY